MPVSHSTERHPPRRAAAAASGPLLIALLLVGCASPVPAPEAKRDLAAASAPAATWHAPRPAANVNEAATAAAAAANTPANDGLAWWRGFDEPLLAELVAAATTDSPTLAAARARLEQARAALAGSETALGPRLDATASTSLVGGRSDGRASPPSTTAGSLGLQAGWELDLFGANRAASRAAGERVGASAADWHATRTALAAEVGSTLIALRGCEAQAVQAGLDAQSRANTATLTDKSAAAGLAAPADAALARAGAASARNAARAQQAQCDTLVKALVELTGQAEPALRQRLAARAGQVPRLVGAGPVLPELPATLLAQRPDVHAAERSVLAAAAEQQQSAARERPQITLAGSLGAQASRSAGVSSDGTSWSLGPLVVNFPLWDAGARRAGTNAARAGYDEAVASYQGTLRRALREVETALVALDSAGARQADAEAAARDFEASLRATEARWRGGLASQFELEDARRSALAAQNVLVDLRRERASAWVTLWRTLGGGFEAGRAMTDALAATPAQRPI